LTRVTLVIDGLAAGGAQREISVMANYWASRGWPVTLLTLAGAATPAFPLNPAIALTPLGTARPRTSAIVRVLGKGRHVPVLRKAIRDSRPDVVISFLDRVNVLTLLATRGLGLPVVVSERTEPAEYHVGWTWERLRAWTYPFAGALVAQTASALRYFPPAPGRIDRVIPNPVVRVQAATEPSTLARPPYRVIGMGRLGPEKGFDRLLEAFARVAARFSEWELEIWGEGLERAALEKLKNELGLGARARLPGFADDPIQRMRAAELFVLSSRFEGFPNVLGEAMACGLAVISYDCPSGPGDMIRHEVDGLLVPPEGGVDALAAALARLMGDPAERRRLAARAIEVVERFDLGRVMGLWDDLLAAVAGRIPE
jgi:GalNAc-alpha-(1->4)-GalNAc-alpha-(1->3)-diNAcBac-PP-undecaprenol alpha-1,4-N-acetyl-D-galactosaminyltransferase